MNARTPPPFCLVALDCSPGAPVHCHHFWALEGLSSLTVDLHGVRLTAAATDYGSGSLSVTLEGTALHMSTRLVPARILGRTKGKVPRVTYYASETGYGWSPDGVAQYLAVEELGQRLWVAMAFRAENPNGVWPLCYEPHFARLYAHLAVSYDAGDLRDRLLQELVKILASIRLR